MSPTAALLASQSLTNRPRLVEKGSFGVSGGSGSSVSAVGPPVLTGSSASSSTAAPQPVSLSIREFTGNARFSGSCALV